jgi:single-stranded DNA-binding protein
MSREALVRFCERARLKCLARLTHVEGRLRIREFEAKDNGGKRQRAEIIANRVQFLGARPAEAKATAEVEGDLASDDAPF